MLPSESANIPSRMRRQIINQSEIKYIYKIALFVIAYVVYSNAIARLSLIPCASINMKIFAELGRLC
jgi:anaerobic C4-dicarboxylate transporter